MGERGAVAERWVTYQEAAKLLRLSPEAVRQRARRQGWPTRRAGNKPNDPTEILVPDSAPVRTGGQPPVQTPEQPPVRPGGEDAPATVPLVMLARLQQDMEAAVRTVEGERDAARQEADQLRERAARAEGEVTGLREALRRADAAVVEMRPRLAETAERLQRSDERLRQSDETVKQGRELLRESQERLAQAQAGAEEARMRAQQLQAALDAAQQGRQVAEGELRAWTTGGPLKRAWRALRGQP
jgi:hypothetical protein